jgi:hypothetical protein
MRSKRNSFSSTFVLTKLPEKTSRGKVKMRLSVIKRAVIYIANDLNYETKSLEIRKHNRHVNKSF